MPGSHTTLGLSFTVLAETLKVGVSVLYLRAFFAGRAENASKRIDETTDGLFETKAFRALFSGFVTGAGISPDSKPRFIKRHVLDCGAPLIGIDDMPQPLAILKDGWIGKASRPGGIF